MFEIQPVNQHYEFKVAALPPWAQEEREKNDILSNPEFQEYLRSVQGTVQDIQMQQDEQGRYYLVKIATENHCFVEVRVNVTYHPRTDGRCGPAEFTLDFIFPARE